MTSMSFAASGAAQAAVDVHVPQLVDQEIASKIFAQDPTLWGTDAESEAAIRLGWTNAPEVSAGLVDHIENLRKEFAAEGVNHFVLCGMGGSSLAPEVITATYGKELTVLDSTDPEQVSAALSDRLESTAVVVSSKSGSTLETDSQRRSFEEAFARAGIDGKERIVIVTDPGSPLDSMAREGGYRAVFNADPNVGGRYSALTAFGLVPSGLAGVDIRALLEEAEEATETLREDSADNIGLALGSALGGTHPLRNKIVIVNEGSGIVGFADWAEQLIAESTGKEGTGVLPVVADPNSPEVSWPDKDVLVVRLVPKEAEVEPEHNQVVLSGDLPAQMMLWEFAVAVAGRLLGIDPFNQPDVEAAKKAARELLDNRPEPEQPLFVDGDIEVRAGSWLKHASTVEEALSGLIKELPEDGYLAVQAYFDRITHAGLSEVRDELAKVSHRPVTFGWGPRFLHSTGQFHKGGPAIGVFLQITADTDHDRDIPDRPFTYGQLIQAQASGDANVLIAHGRPVLRLNLRNRTSALHQLTEAISHLAGKDA